MEWKNKRLPVEEIPFTWSVKDFKEVFKVNQGLQIPIAKREKVSTNTNHFYLTNEFIKNRHNGGDNYYIENPPPNVVCSSDDILMTRTGNTGIVVTNVDGAFHNNFFKIKYDKNELHKNFVYYYLKSSYVQKMIRIYAGSSTIPDLNHSDFYKIKLLKPSYIEQKTISEIIYTWDKAIKLKQQLIDLKKEQRKGLMQKLLTGKVRVSTFEDKWEKYKIKDVAESYDKYREPVKASDRIEGETPYYGANGIQGLIDGYTHNGEYVLLAEDGVRDIENYSVFYVNKKIWVNNHAHVLRGKSSLLDTKFLYYSLQVANIKPFLVGGSRAKLNAKAMMEIPLKIPSLMEQKMIVEVLTNFDDKILLLKKELEVRKEQKKGLMQQLLTGKTRVKV